MFQCLRLIVVMVTGKIPHTVRYDTGIYIYICIHNTYINIPYSMNYFMQVLIRYFFYFFYSYY